MPEFGLIQGLSQDMGFNDKINDLRYHELENRRALAENEAKQKLFVDDLDYQNAANSYDSGLIKDFAKSCRPSWPELTMVYVVRLSGVKHQRVLPREDRCNGWIPTHTVPIGHGNAGSRCDSTICGCV